MKRKIEVEKMINTQTVSATFTENGFTTLTPEAGYTFSTVNITVDLPIWNGSYHQN